MANFSYSFFFFLYPPPYLDQFIFFHSPPYIVDSKGVLRHDEL